MCWSILINLLINCQSKTLTKVRKRDFFESAYIKYFLEQGGNTLVYVDEFHINLRNSKLYSWSPRGSPAIISFNHDPWTMSIIFAISNRRLEGVKASTRFINAEIFIWFLEDIWERLTDEVEGVNDPVLIWDNALLHVWKESAEFMKDRGIRCVAIIPYLPQLNSEEKTIRVVKNKLREAWLDNQQLSIRLLKKIIDKITSKTWKRWINSSRIEILNKMKLLNV